MKKKYNYIIAAAILLTGMLQLVSCKDSNNDWTTDPSVTKQRPPSSLTVEVDSATLDMSIQIGTIAKAAYYELQMSESALTSNEDIPVDIKDIAKLQTDCMELIKRKCGLSDKAKDKVSEICKAADENANGDPRLIEDADVLAELKKQLMAVRK